MQLINRLGIGIIYLGITLVSLAGVPVSAQESNPPTRQLSANNYKEIAKNEAFLMKRKFNLTEKQTAAIDAEKEVYYQKLIALNNERSGENSAEINTLNQAHEKVIRSILTKEQCKSLDEGKVKMLQQQDAQKKLHFKKIRNN